MAIQTTHKNLNFRVGDQIHVHLRVTEGDKERVQIFSGLVIGIRGRGDNRTFTVRKIAAGGIGVERIFVLCSPWITKIEIKKTGKVRRAKLNYVRAQSARQISQISLSNTHPTPGSTS